jgi:hypothetical protein
MLGHSIVSQHFMEPEGSIPNSQELSTYSYTFFYITYINSVRTSQEAQYISVV